jgi:hypothetical protein
MGVASATGRWAVRIVGRKGGEGGVWITTTTTMMIVHVRKGEGVCRGILQGEGVLMMNGDRGEMLTMEMQSIPQV